MSKTRPPICPYCNKVTVLVDGSIIYGPAARQNMRERQFYNCHSCKAYVGTHKGTDKPLGTPAKEPLRKMRMKAHNAFDKLWRPGTKKIFESRARAYAWLAEEMGTKVVHIGEQDEAGCRKVIELSHQRAPVLAEGMIFTDG